MASRRFTRLTEVVAASLYETHFNQSPVREVVRIMPAIAIGITDHI
jgi:hypothetical protein